MMRGNNLNDKHYELELTTLNTVWVGTILDRIFWIGIFRVGVFQVVIILDGDFPGRNCPGGRFLGGNFPGQNCPGGNFPKRELSEWGLPGENQPGGSFFGTPYGLQLY